MVREGWKGHMLKVTGGHNCSKCFSMSVEILWQVKPNGQFPPLTEDLQLGLASRASAEEGVNITNAP